jgi:uncharacterized protein (DUF1501 family)
MTSSHRHESGLVRREFLQVGFSAFAGLSLSGFNAIRALASPKSPAPRAKSMILVFLTGAPSHLDTFDMKPDAPEGIRGEFKPIATKTPGISISEHLPRLAQRTDKLAIVRTMSHDQTNHLNATHRLLTGMGQPGAFFDKIASRDDYPCYASALDYIRPRSDGIPSGVMLPTYLMEGPLTWPGQHAGFLGPKHDPWQIKKDPNAPDFRDESLSLPVGFSVERLDRRRTLLEEIAGKSPRASIDAQRDLAFSLLVSGKVSKAFDLSSEDPKVRDRYGRHTFGQSILLARRLVQAGVPIVQVNLGKVQNWDTHSGNFKSLKDRLLPPTDTGVSALLDDLEAHGMLDETLVVVTGEFGRTPRIGVTTGNVNGKDGRDHWAACFTTVLAGAGIRGGRTIGQSDKNGAYPASKPYSPADLAATIYESMGIDPATEVRDRFNRPITLCTGRPITPVFDGSLA